MEAPRNAAVGYTKTGRFLRMATLLACGCWGGSALFAQSPAPQQPPVQIERWYGHRRVPLPPRAPAAALVPTQLPMEQLQPPPRVLRGKATVWPINWFFDNTVVFQVEATAPQGLPTVVQADLRPQPDMMVPTPAAPLAQALAQAAVTGGEVIVQAAVKDLPAELPSTEVPATARATEVASLLTTARPIPAPVAMSEQATESLFYRMAFLQLLTTLAAFVVGPLVLIIMLRLLLRKVLAGNGHLKIELLNQPHLALVGGYQGMMPPTSLTEATPAEKPAEAPAEEEFTGEYFELGPTYEEEKALVEEQLRQQELALLAMIAQENLELQQQINTLAEDQEPAQQESLSLSTEDVISPTPETTEVPVTVAPAVIPEEITVPVVANDNTEPTDLLFAAVANRTRKRNAA